MARSRSFLRDVKRPRGAPRRSLRASLRWSGWRLARLLSRLEGTMFRRTRYSRPKMVAIGAVGSLSMLVYYPVWRYLFPQPYENFWLRVVVAALFVPLALIRWWPRRALNFLPSYWYTVITLALPYFCGYMTLRNATPAWWMTHLASVMLMMMLFDLASFLIVFSTGTVMAILTYLCFHQQTLPAMALLEYLPLLVFALVGGATCSVSQNIAEQSQVEALTTASNNIAHELRTPLGSLRIAAQAVQRYLPDLLRSQHLAQRAGLPVAELRTAHIQALERSVEAMEREVTYANTVIDMLLLAARPIGELPFETLSARFCVDQALRRYPYESRVERERVFVDGNQDFKLRGSETLLVHVLFNLLRNALHHTGRAGRGTIRLRIDVGNPQPAIIIRDTGPGIAPDVLPRIFNRFYSHADGGGGVAGLGIGLAFVRDAMTRMGGDISCSSRWGEYTQFVLKFPRWEDAEST
ncbi:HAMP domain-containing sensor histidine kinase [Oleiagrimonas sp. C23AA]|uniref:sensor histidine kinase n=1 Tax=Oleiagrimonas sp. C23AA TaxID=2719047 RepID=UPI00141E5A56|nr:HAMP domain-containing sensor histidine kinase [Oleiagrimonas sp. C23AA]NII09629.1 HAMP domain-containing histidine kinase [Oleiagrimonas sp. C23AA]